MGVVGEFDQHETPMYAKNQEGINVVMEYGYEVKNDRQT